MGLANRVVEAGKGREEAEKLAVQIAGFPQRCMLSDRRSAHEQWELSREAAFRNEYRLGLNTILSGETQAGAGRFAGGAGRHGRFFDEQT